MRQVVDYEPVSYEEYLRIEEASRDVRYEYVHGFLYAMVGANRRHHQIIRRLVLRLGNVAEGGPCEIASETVKLRAAADVYYYPDLAVTCDPDDRHPLEIHRPCLAVEVLTPSTRSVDMREKRATYRRIPTLLAYLIFYQDEQRVERHWREDVDSPWQVQLLTEGVLPIPCPVTEVEIDAIYRNLPPAE